MSSSGHVKIVRFWSIPKELPSSLTLGKNNKRQFTHSALKIPLNQDFMVALVSIFVHHHFSGFVEFTGNSSC